MGNKLFALIILAALAAQPALAQTLIPATSEDINEFDRQVAEQMKKSKPAGSQSKDSFGAEVSEEAKALGNSGSDQGKDFGKWVSSQRKKTDQGRPAAQGSVNAGGSANSQTHGPPDGKGKKK